MNSRAPVASIAAPARPLKKYSQRTRLPPKPAKCRLAITDCTSWAEPPRSSPGIWMSVCSPVTPLKNTWPPPSPSRRYSPGFSMKRPNTRTLALLSLGCSMLMKLTGRPRPSSAWTSSSSIAVSGAAMPVSSWGAGRAISSAK